MAGGLICPTTGLSRDTGPPTRGHSLSLGSCRARGLGHKLTGRGRKQLWVGGLRAGASRGRRSPPAGLSCGPGAQAVITGSGSGHQRVLDCAHVQPTHGTDAACRSSWLGGVSFGFCLSEKAYVPSLLKDNFTGF
ncbi:unnamed protein product [Rangifer tarandus platyrhynchus]|uniref:Uncharacterized protein n=2 Tax=Rangifer tarandus platyrhynchus TaxID=3082113 RepID=A0ABN8ZAR2_RANTA|nr:unnamed protein product [Rangifer tarandus platyrhynchus]